MKNILLLLVLQLPFLICYGQKTEVSVQVSSGFSFYGGKSATSTPSVYVSDVGPPFFYANSPFSKKSDFPYGVAIQVQHVSEKNFFLGVRIGYDRFSTKSSFDGYIAMSPGKVLVENGRITLQNDMVQANPYLGYRLPAKNIRLDVLAGVNAGAILKRTYMVSFDGKPDFFDSEANSYPIDTKIDFGPTVGLAAEYKRTGIQISYCHGLVNYMDNAYFSAARAYSRYVRLGMSYRIR
jgi:hypothetical protein